MPIDENTLAPSQWLVMRWVLEFRCHIDSQHEQKVPFVRVRSLEAVLLKRSRMSMRDGDRWCKPPPQGIGQLMCLLQPVGNECVAWRNIRDAVVAAYQRWRIKSRIHWPWKGRWAFVSMQENNLSRRRGSVITGLSWIITTGRTWRVGGFFHLLSGTGKFPSQVHMHKQYRTLLVSMCNAGGGSVGPPLRWNSRQTPSDAAPLRSPDDQTEIVRRRRVRRCKRCRCIPATCWGRFTWRIHSKRVKS